MGSDPMAMFWFKKRRKKANKWLDLWNPIWNPLWVGLICSLRDWCDWWRWLLRLLEYVPWNRLRVGRLYPCKVSLKIWGHRWLQSQTVGRGRHTYVVTIGQPLDVLCHWLSVHGEWGGCLQGVWDCRWRRRRWQGYWILGKVLSAWNNDCRSRRQHLLSRLLGLGYGDMLKCLMKLGCSLSNLLCSNINLIYLLWNGRLNRVRCMCWRARNRCSWVFNMDALSSWMLDEDPTFRTPKSMWNMYWDRGTIIPWMLYDNLCWMTSGSRVVHMQMLVSNMHLGWQVRIQVMPQLMSRRDWCRNRCWKWSELERDHWFLRRWR